MKKYSLSIVFLIFSNCILGQSQLSIKQIDSLFAQLTWVDIKSKEDEELIKKIIIIVLIHLKTL